MNIDLSRADLINEVNKSFKNDVDFFFDVIDGSTTNYECYVGIVEKLCIQLKQMQRPDVIEYVKEIIEKVLKSE